MKESAVKPKPEDRISRALVVVMLVVTGGGVLAAAAGMLLVWPFTLWALFHGDGTAWPAVVMLPFVAIEMSVLFALAFSSYKDIATKESTR